MAISQITGSTGGVVLTAASYANPVTVTATGTVFGTAYGLSAASSWIVDNLGSIGASAGFGVYLGAGGSVTNLAGGSITGQDGVNIEGAPGAVANLGTIAGATYGVYLAAGGTITNGSSKDATALIQGASPYGTLAGAAIVVKNGAGAIRNEGIIASARISYGGGPTYAGPSIVLGDGGRITNATPFATISNGVQIAGAAGSVVNRGVIGGILDGYGPHPVYGQYSRSIAMENGGEVDNIGASATIRYGVSISGGIAQVINGGTIGSSNYANGGYYGSEAPSIVLSSGGRVLNGANGNDAANLKAGIYIGGAAGRVINTGTIGAPFRFQSTGGRYPSTYDKISASIEMSHGGYVENGANGVASAFIKYGVNISGGVGFVVNNGTIGGPPNIYTGFEYEGPHFGYYYSRSTITNPAIVLSSGGTVRNGTSADSNAVVSGVTISGGAGTVVNYGEIDFVLTDGGVVDNGQIKDTVAFIGRVSLGADVGTVTNFGTIGSFDLLNSSDVLIEEASGSLEYGGDGSGEIKFAPQAGAGTISNLDQISLPRIEVEAGASWTFIGGGIGGQTTLRTFSAITERGTLANYGTISASAIMQLGTNSELANQAGAEVLLMDNVSIVPDGSAIGASIVNAGLIEKRGGTGISKILPYLVNTGQIVVADGALDIAGAVYGEGAFRIDGGATLEFGSSVEADGAVKFAGPDGTLKLDYPAEFLASVSRFGAGDTIDLRSIGFTAATVISYAGSKAGGALTVKHGWQAAQIALLGQYVAADFHASSDGHGGTDITYVTPPSTAPPLLAASH